MQDTAYAEILYEIMLGELMPAEHVLGAGQTPEQAIDAMEAHFHWLPKADVRAHVEAIFRRYR